MTMSVRFCLSYASLQWDFIAFKMNIISKRKRIADTNVVNDVTYMRQSNSDVICHDKLYYNSQPSL